MEQRKPEDFNEEGVLPDEEVEVEGEEWEKEEDLDFDVRDLDHALEKRVIQIVDRVVRLRREGVLDSHDAPDSAVNALRLDHAHQVRRTRDRACERRAEGRLRCVCCALRSCKPSRAQSGVEEGRC